MVLEKLSLANFKSFRETEVSLDPFNVLIGANASGKSNFLSALEFLRDLERYGLENAISIQGGPGYLRNRNLTDDVPLIIRTEVNVEFPLFIPRESGSARLYCRRIEYELRLAFEVGTAPWFVQRERLTLKLSRDKKRRRRNQRHLSFDSSRHEEQLAIIRRGNNFAWETSLAGNYDFDRMLRGIGVKRPSPAPTESLLFGGSLQFPFGPDITSWTDISLFDFDPKMPKQPVRFSGPQELEEDGRNLALAIRNILAQPDKRKQFLNILKDILPFINKVRTQQLADTSVLFSIQEKFGDELDFPAHFVSDGTVNVAALVTALFFDDAAVTIIEEPERNLHPALISRVVNAAEDAARNKQIFFTTHNPEIVRHTDIGNLLLVRRDYRGYSRVVRPEKSRKVRRFLSEELGLEDLYVQGILK